MTIFISLTYENVFLLYEMMYNKIFIVIIHTLLYNDNKYFIIHESVFLIIRDDV